ncbi:MAG: anti-sigma factor family protein [Thiobacillus sp.]
MEFHTDIPQDELMAFVDGVLDAERVHYIEQLMRKDEALLAVVVALQAQQQALRAGLDPVLDEPIPLRLLQAGKTSRFSFQRIAAGMVWMAIGLTIGALSSGYYVSQHAPPWLAQTNRATDLPGFVRQASVAYAVFAPEVRHPVEVGSGDAKGLNTWLSKRLQRPIQAPDLSEAGFTLMGGRLLPGETNKPAAQFMYEDSQGQRITVYLRGMAEPTTETAFRYTEQGSVNTFYWVEGDWGYALSGELSRKQLSQIAQRIHAHLSEQLDKKISVRGPL